MIQRGIATFTLDYGKCPPWLFRRMTSLGREMIRAIIALEGPDEFVRRIADPAWFQSLGTVLAFDWNASGLTTILTAALKEAIRGEEKDLGFFICGGKGKTSKKTPDQIIDGGAQFNFSQDKTNKLVYNSKMAAKVDSALVQAGYQIYHHAFFFTKNGAWTVIQQGMNTQNQSARRYHWHSADVKDLVCEPHSGIVSDLIAKKPLNMTAQTSGQNRTISTQLVSNNNYMSLMKDMTVLQKYYGPHSQMTDLATKYGQLKLLNLDDTEFHWYPKILNEDFSKSKYLQKILWELCDRKPENYEKLLAMKGVGPKTIRALALVSELIYGAKPSYEDPARYSFAHGGKDGTPYPVDRPTYDQTITLMKEYIKKTKIPISEKAKAFSSLDNLGYRY
jgi:uncharacterized protein